MTEDERNERDSKLFKAISTSVGRKRVAQAMIDGLGFMCRKCGHRDKNTSYVHSEEECVVEEVLNT